MNLEHANMTVASIDESVRFLSLVFPESRVRGGGAIHGDPERGRWVHFGDDEHYIALQENLPHTARQDVTYANDGINHLGFVVEGLDDIQARLKAAGYEMTPVSVMTGHPYRRRAYFFDGNGVEWELVEYLSEVAGERNDYSA